jgi:hypothetical protein
MLIKFTAQQTVRYLQIQSAQSTLHNKLYDIYRYSPHSQLYTTNRTIFTDTVRTVNFTQQTDGERLRGVSRQAFLGIA